MFNKPKKETTTYGIIGLGRFGYALAEELASSGAELLVLERDEEKGMSPEFVGREIAKIAMKPKGKPLCTVGFTYKFLNLLCKYLPCRLRSFIVYQLYAR